MNQVSSINLQQRIRTTGTVFALILAISGLSAPSAFSQESQSPTQQGTGRGHRVLESKKNQLAALDAILLELRTHYGMDKYKEEQFGVTIESVEKKYKHLIREAMTLEEYMGFRETQKRDALSPDEFRQILIGLAAEFRDGHLRIMRNSDNAWTTGLRVAASQSRLFVTGVIPDIFIQNSTDFPLHIGDEILEVNGRSVQEIAAENLMYVQSGATKTRWQKALESVLIVDHKVLPEVKEGARVKIKFRKYFSDGQYSDFEGVLHWNNIDELLKRRSDADYVESGGSRDAPGKTLESYAFGMMGTRATYFKQGIENLKLPYGTVTDHATLLNAQIESERSSARAKSGAVPKSRILKEHPLSELKPNHRIDAYTINHKGRTFGVLRIPGYHPPASELMNEILWINEILGRFEGLTDSLIIDHTGNPGGYVAEVMAVASFFASHGTLETGTVEFKLSDTLLNAESEGLGSSIAQHNYGALRLEELRIELLEDMMKEGKTWSGPLPFGGNAPILGEGESGRLIPPFDSSHIYSKPVLIINDSRSGSGGDIFPRILQSNGRALVFGENSMGLGGPVYRRNASMPGSEVFMQCTYGFCLDRNGQPIENIGVVPDINREVQPADIISGFRGFSSEVLLTAHMMAQGKSPEEIQKTLAQRRMMADLQSGRIQTNEATAAVETLVSKFRAQEEAAAGLKGEDRIREVLAQYRNFLTGLSVLEGESLEGMRLPLPELLRESDPLLRTLTERNEVLIRLRELLSVPRFKNEPLTIELIKLVHQAALQLPEVTRFEASCEALLLPGA